MPSLSEIHKQTRRKLSNRGSAIGGNLILKPSRFDEGEGLGIVRGTVMTGPRAGTEISVRLNGTLSAADYKDEGGRSYVDIENGGLLRLEDVREGKDTSNSRVPTVRREGGNDAIYDCRWAVTFDGQPTSSRKSDHEHIFDVVTSRIETGRRDQKDRPVEYLSLLDTAAQVKVTDFDAMQSNMAKAFETHGHVTMFAVEAGSMARLYYERGGEMKDGTYVQNDPAERAKAIVDNFRATEESVKAFENVFEGSGFSMVPTRSMRIGPRTALEIEQEIAKADREGKPSRITTIDPQDFVCASMGARLQGALSQDRKDDPLPAKAADKLAEAFLDTAGEEAKAAFNRGGWRSVSDEDIAAFFKGRGVELKAHPDEGFTLQSLLVQHPKGSEGNGLVVKAFSTRATTPYPDVEALSDLRKEYYDEMRSAVVKALEPAPAAEAKAAKSEAEKPAEVEKPVEAEKAEAKAPEAGALSKKSETPGSGKAPSDLDSLLDEAEETMRPDS